MAGRHLTGLSLMVTALGILILPGLVVNNMVNNGLINTSQAQTCTTSGGGTCVLSSPVGCQVNTNFCSLSGSAFAFLNQCSPFTNILTLNFVGFVSSLFTNCGQSQTQTAPVVPAASSSGNTSFTQCTRDSSGSLGYTYAFRCTTITPAITGVTAPIVIVCTGWNGVFNPGSFVACNFFDSSSPANQFSAQCVLSGTYTILGVGSPATLTSAVCSNVGNFSTSAVGVSASPGTGVGLLGFIFTLLGASLLVLVGLGIGFTAPTAAATGGGGISSNPQGSKFAQTFGIGLLIWSPLYSEFSTWFDLQGVNPSFLPYGLGNILVGNADVPGIVATVLIAMFFFGLYAMSQSGTTTSS